MAKFNTKISEKIMKSLLLYISVFFSSISVLHAQIDDGKYTYSNDEIIFSFEVSDYGWTVSSVKITIIKTNQAYYGQGEWFKINPNGVDEDYSGPLGWYQLQTNNCEYQFDEPTGNTLVLSEIGCKNGNVDKLYNLKYGLQNLNTQLQDFNNSDVGLMTEQIKSEFEKWLSKGEFEKSEEHKIRLELRELKFLEICEAVVQQTLSKEVEYVSGENWYRDNSGKESFVLYEYNADKELFPFYFRYKQMEFYDTIFVPFSDAKEFKDRTDYFSISYPKKRKDYVFSNYYLYPSIIFFQNVEGKKPIEVPLNFVENPLPIQFNTNDLNLSNYNFEELSFDFITYKTRKSEILLKNAQQMEEKEELETALSLYSILLEFDKNSSIAKSKIESITQTLNERKRKVLIEKAQELFDKGKLSESKKLYVEANSIRNASEIDGKIKDIENTIVESKKKHDELKKQMEIISINNSLAKQTNLFDELEKMHRGYGVSYNTCVDSINSELSAKKSAIDFQFNEFQVNQNIEIWTVTSQKLLELANSFVIEYESYKKFETSIFSALQNDDKKYLKILKDDEIRNIIESVINTN